MGVRSKYEYLKEVLIRYKYASKVQKKTILDEFCATCNYNRKYAIRLLNTKEQTGKSKKLSKRGRKKIYDDPMIIKVLRDIWVAANLPCAKRLTAMIPRWLPHYDNYILTENVKDKLMRISPASIDRLMAPFRSKYTKSVEGQVYSPLKAV